MRTWSKLRWLVIVGLIWVGLIVVAVYFKVIEPEDFFSSPTASRDLPGFKEESSVGIVEPKKWEIDEARPASDVMAELTRIDGVNDDFMLNWKGEPEAVAVPQKENWTTGMMGDDAIELVAFATWVPQADDALGENAQWEITPIFRDPKTLNEITKDKMKALGIPDSFCSMSPPKEYISGKMRLIFRTSTMEYVRFVTISGANDRTKAKVTYDLESLGEEEPNQRKIGEWAYYDTALVTWHDAPVKFNAIALTGEPIVKSLEQKLGAQVNFDDFLRMQWVAPADGNVTDETSSYQGFVKAAGLKGEGAAELFIEINPNEERDKITLGDLEYGHPATEEAVFEKLIEKTQIALNGESLPENILSSDILYEGGYWEYISVEAAQKLVPEWADFIAKHATIPEPVPDNIETAMWLKVKQPAYDWHPKTLVRISSDEYRDHCGWIREDGSVEWRWDSEEEENAINLHSTRQMADMSKPMTVVFLPKMGEMNFEIGGMPDLPNSADIPDLFDMKLPRITLPENPESAEDRMIQLICVVTQNGWDINNKWKTDAPKELPSDRTFRDKTPQELLNWYLQVTPGAHIDYDEAEQVLSFNKEEESLWDKTKAFFSEMIDKVRI